jgi:hypothetical protein
MAPAKSSHRDELLAVYAEVIRTPADSVPAGSPITQTYETTEHGHKIRLGDKAAAGAALAKMCGWDQPTKVVVTTDPLLAYLKELRTTPIEGRVIEEEPLHLEVPPRDEAFDELETADV